jgi:hypothetical protein
MKLNYNLSHTFLIEFDLSKPYILNKNFKIDFQKIFKNKLH